MPEETRKSSVLPPLYTTTMFVDDLGVYTNNRLSSAAATGYN
jgi:hypothetical protein